MFMTTDSKEIRRCLGLRRKVIETSDGQKALNIFDKGDSVARWRDGVTNVMSL